MRPTAKRTSLVLGIPVAFFLLFLAFPYTCGGMFLWTHWLAGHFPECSWLYGAIYTGTVVHDDSGATLLARFGADLSGADLYKAKLSGANLGVGSTPGSVNIGVGSTPG